MRPRARRRPHPALVLLLGVSLALAVQADEVRLTDGTRLEGHVTRTPTGVRVNRYFSRAEGMTWGVVEVPAEGIDEIEPRRDRVWATEALGRLAAAGVAEKSALLEVLRATRCREESRRLAAEILALDPGHERAAEVAKSARGDPPWVEQVLLDPARAAALRDVVDGEDGLARREAALRLPLALGLRDRPEVIERMARSAHLPRGEQHEVVLAADLPRVSLFVPETYDPVRPHPLLLALHGGVTRDGGVTGSPRDACALFVEGARREGWLLVCPEAVEAPWSARENREGLDRLLEHVLKRYHVDLERIAVAGQGSGADFALAWSTANARRLAAVGLAGLSTPWPLVSLAGRDVPVWLHHGAADPVVPVAVAREAAERLRRRGADVVYCELPNAEHGLPREAEADFFLFLRGRRRARAATAWPTSSFDARSNAQEVAELGDPRAAWGLTLDPEAELPVLLAALRSGRGEAEWAARRLAERSEASDPAPVLALLADAAAPPAARRWAAWLAAVKGWRAACPRLGDLLRAGGEARMLGAAARAAAALGCADLEGDLLQALDDAVAAWRETEGARAAAGGAPLLVALLDALGRVGGPETAPLIEAAVVVPVLREGRPARATGQGPDAGREARAAVAAAVGRAYGRLGAEATLVELAEVALHSEAAAREAFGRGLAEGRASRPERGSSGQGGLR